MARSPQKAVGVRLSVEGADEVKRALEQLGDRGEKALKHLEDGGRGASTGLKAVDGASRELQGGLRNVANNAGPVGNALADIGPKGLLAAAGIGATVLAIGKALQISREAVSEFDELSKKIRDLGIDSDTYQGLQFGALETGVGDRLDDALRTFSIRAGQAQFTGTGELVEKLRLLDEELLENIKDAATFEEQLDLMAEKLAETSNATEFATLSALAFGEGNVRVGQILADGADGIDRYIARARELGIVIDRDVLANAEEMENQFGIAAKVIDINLKQALINIAPVLVQLSEGVVSVAAAIQHMADATAPLTTRPLDIMQAQLADKQALLDGDGWLWNRDALEREVDDLRAAIEERLAAGENTTQDDGPVMRYIEQFARMSAEVDRSLEAVATKGEQIAAVRAELEQTVAQFEALRGQEGVDGEALDRQIARAQQAAQRQIERINASGGASSIEKERQQLERLAETWRSKLTPALDQHLALVHELDAAREAGFLSESEHLAALTQAQKDYAEAVDEQRRAQLEASDSFVDGMTLGLERYLEKGQTVAEGVADVMERSFGKASDALGDFVTTGKADFSELTRSILNDLARMMAQQAFRSLLGGAFGGTPANQPIDLLGGSGGGGIGGFISGLFDGMFAEGGYIRPGHWGIAGENGPEPVFGGRSGMTVVPNMGGSGAQFSAVFHTTVDASGPGMDPTRLAALLDERDRRNEDRLRIKMREWADDPRREY